MSNQTETTYETDTVITWLINDEVDYDYWNAQLKDCHRRALADEDNVEE